MTKQNKIIVREARRTIGSAGTGNKKQSVVIVNGTVGRGLDLDADGRNYNYTLFDYERDGIKVRLYDTDNRRNVREGALLALRAACEADYRNVKAGPIARHVAASIRANTPAGDTWIFATDGNLAKAEEHYRYLIVSCVGMARKRFVTVADATAAWESARKAAWEAGKSDAKVTTCQIYNLTGHDIYLAESATYKRRNNVADWREGADAEDWRKAAIRAGMDGAAVKAGPRVRRVRDAIRTTIGGKLAEVYADADEALERYEAGYSAGIACDLGASEHESISAREADERKSCFQVSAATGRAFYLVYITDAGAFELCEAGVYVSRAKAEAACRADNENFDYGRKTHGWRHRFAKPYAVLGGLAGVYVGDSNVRSSLLPWQLDLLPPVKTLPEVYPANRSALVRTGIERKPEALPLADDSPSIDRIARIAAKARGLGTADAMAEALAEIGDLCDLAD